MFLLFINFILSTVNDALIEAGIVYIWEGYSEDTRVFVGTSDGLFHYIDIEYGKVLWTIDTGGSVCNSTSSSKTTFIPSIDGYLYAYTEEQGYRRLALPIRDLIFIAPFRTQSGEIFSSAKSTTIFALDQQTGKISTTYRSNNTNPSQNSKELNQNKLIILRVDYDLLVYDSSNQFVRYSEFEIFPNPIKNPKITTIEIRTLFNNMIAITSNGTRRVEVIIPGIVTSVYGSAGKFTYKTLSNEEEVSNGFTFFLNENKGGMAIPALPQAPPTRLESLLSNIPMLPRVTRKEPLTTGLHWSAQRYLGVTKTNTFNSEPSKTLLDGKLFSIIFLCMYVFFRVVEYFVKRMQQIEDKIEHIIIDKEDDSIGYFNGTPLTIIRIEHINKRSLTLARSFRSLDGTPTLVKDEEHKGTTIIGYQKLGRYDFNNFDPQKFLKDALNSLVSIFQSGIVHGAIDESMIFADDNGRILIGGLEWNASKTLSIEKRSKDIFALGVIVKNNYSIQNSPLLIDLLSDMLNKDSKERPTPEEALQHPYFWSIERRASLYYQVNDELNSPSIPYDTLFAFERHRVHVVQSVSWMTVLPKHLISDLKQRGDYGGDSLRDLIRMIRNKMEHTGDIPPKLEKIFGRESTSIFNYFDNLFPNLFLYTYYFYIKYLL